MSNDEICQRLGQLNGEEEVREKILSMNGIRLRHYAQDQHQQATHDVYELGSLAAQRCLEQNVDTRAISLLVGGTTFAPLAGPGFVSILHERLSSAGALAQPVEISSHAGICSSATTALVAAIRAVAGGHHGSSLCVGAEHASDVLKAKSIRPIDDRADHVNVRNSRWFMSVFLRFMLSDGAGAFLLQDRPDPDRLSLQVNWTHAMSFANEAPLCMKLDCRSALLSQDLSVLSTHLFPTADKFLDHALETHDDTIDSHTIILPHMSSFFFRRKMERVIAGRCSDDSNPVPYWTNLETAGNTGAASIFVMLDQYLERRELSDGDRMLLFVPESGQFNFVLISLTAGAP
ncbi:MAG: 3-oxoacyl-[acyl-carrier-protein] synthase III C-terminal domain-containing protein [Pirellulaceae bacterium]|nr:3-oxoacyl-[acyl-carrier-protein] synthase III C-terminal domain-containing protein [Pirellulaceae bacterium]